MEWITKGFEGFSKGTMENGGQNLYVSKKGILQRIFQYVPDPREYRIRTPPPDLPCRSDTRQGSVPSRLAVRHSMKR